MTAPGCTWSGLPFLACELYRERTNVLIDRLGIVNLMEWARVQGVHPQTAYRWFREGTLPVPAVRVGSRSVLVAPDTATATAVTGIGGLGLYARVSSDDQKPDLDRQVARLAAWAAASGQPVARVEAEVGPGANGARPGAHRLLADLRVHVGVVEHRDRLGRVNTELVEAALSAHGRRLVVPARMRPGTAWCGT